MEELGGLQTLGKLALSSRKTAKLFFQEFEVHQALAHLIMRDHQVLLHILTIWSEQVRVY